MKQAPLITVGMAGAGYAAWLHCCGYDKLHCCRIRLKTVADPDQKRAQKIADDFGAEQICTDFYEMVKDPEIDVIDIVTPPFLHAQMLEAAFKAGKHVICEKPLTGYFGEPDDAKPIGHVSKQKMYDKVCKELDALSEIVKVSKGKFFYAENFVYATPLVKAMSIITAKKSKILFLRGEECLKGSSSAVAGEWSGTGGGTMIRCGIHPLTGILYLKSKEAEARGENIRPVSVVCDAGKATACLNEHEHRHISARPNDVEDFAQMVITFSDGTKASVLATDTVLGGTRNKVEVFCNDGVLECNITPNDMLKTYYLDEDGLDGVNFSEMLPAKTGWNKVFISDEIIRGYQGELQNFMECIAFNRTPEISFDLAAQSIRVLYAAYLSAESGKKVNL